MISIEAETLLDRVVGRARLDDDVGSVLSSGHSHGAMQYTWEGKRVFQVNNAKAEIGSGNRDGNGSFASVRITDEKLAVVMCRWLDDTGRYELIGLRYSGPARL